MLNAKFGHTLLTWDVFAHPENIEQGIKDTADLGFAGTDTGGGLFEWWEQNRPGQLKRILKEAGIPMVTLFQFGNWFDPAGASGLVEQAKKWSASIKEMGGEMLMLVPGGRREEPPVGFDDFKQMADTMTKCGEAAHAAGIDATMHPHWGTAAETRLEIELLLTLLDPKIVGFAPDTGQIAKGGADPMPVVERWADRVRYVHMKDLAPEWEEMRKAGVPLRSPEGYAEMGQGVIGFERLVPILDKVNFSGWLMAELDESKRSGGESAALAKACIEKVFGVKLGR